MKQGTVRRQEKALDHPPLQAARQTTTAESGQTLLEFALMLPYLMLLLLGIAELGRAAFITIEVTNAATAAAEYGSQTSDTAADIVGMQEKALCDADGFMVGRGGQFLPICNTTGLLMTGNITATNGCTCDEGAGTSCSPMPGPGNCSDFSCASGQVVECVQVTTHADFGPLFHYPGLPTTYQANGLAIQRVRQP